MLAVRQSTAFETAIGPVLDANGVAVTDCVVGDFKIKKTSGNFAALNGSATLTHVSAGFYDLVLTTSDVDTVGVNVVAIDDTTNTCSPLYLQVVEEAVYDAVFAASAAGYQVPIWAAANSTVNLSATTIKTATDVETDTADIQTRLPAALVSGRMDSDVQRWRSGTPVVLDGSGYVQATVPILGGEDATNFVGNTTSSLSSMPTYVWAAAARTLTALDEDTTTLDLDATIRAAVGLASANLDTQLDALPTAAEIFAAVLTSQLTEAYAADGTAPTLAQAIFLIQQSLHEFAISGTTRTVKKLDGTTTAATFTLDSATAPTSTTRAS